MRFSFKTWGQQIEWPMLRDIWIEADRGGFWDGVWLNDHFYPPKSPADTQRAALSHRAERWLRPIRSGTR